MDRAQVLERITNVVTEQLNVDAAKVVESATFVEDLGADSLDLVEVVMAFEDEFETSIPDEALESIKTIGDAVDYVVAHS
ncbi:MAG: acyl carrier protein [Actinomycetes bacterium]|jgi:acyl carrier protein|nr:acyl carrier protein [Actinomycetes bacterium]